MKILFAQTNYPGFLEGFYKKNTDWRKSNYNSLFNMWSKEYFGSSNFYSKSLKKYGWEANEFVLNDWNLQSKWMSKNRFKTYKKEGLLYQLTPKILRTLISPPNWILDIFLKQIDHIRPDVVYMFNLKMFNKNQLKKIKSKTKLLVGQIASPLPKSEDLLKEFDLIISSFPHFVEKFKKDGIRSEYLEWAFKNSILNNIKPRAKKKYDVVYVGGLSLLHKKGNQALEKLAKKVPIKFWGYGANTLKPNSIIRKNYVGEAWGKDMYKIFSESKIVINRHIDIAEEYANNMRMYEVTGMGTLLITDHKKNIKEFFEPEKEIITYKNANDLIKKVRYYLKNDEEREKIAKAGQKRTLKNHTYNIRMKELNKILRKHL